MKIPFHKAIRAFAVYMKTSTDKWVVPLYITKMVDEGHYKSATKELDKQELLWPNDPEITFYRTLVNFLNEEI
jgi:hypothetical protein